MKGSPQQTETGGGRGDSREMGPDATRSQSGSSEGCVCLSQEVTQRIPGQMQRTFIPFLERYEIWQGQEYGNVANTKGMIIKCRESRPKDGVSQL